MLTTGGSISTILPTFDVDEYEQFLGGYSTQMWTVADPSGVQVHTWISLTI